MSPIIIKQQAIRVALEAEKKKKFEQAYLESSKESDDEIKEWELVDLEAWPE